MARIAKAVQEIRDILDTNADRIASFVVNKYVTYRNNSTTCLLYTSDAADE